MITLKQFLLYFVAVNGGVVAGEWLEYYEGVLNWPFVLWGLGTALVFVTLCLAVPDGLRLTTEGD